MLEARCKKSEAPEADCGSRCTVHDCGAKSKAKSYKSKCKSPDTGTRGTRGAAAP